jgi:hypothetical protein
MTKYTLISEEKGSKITHEFEASDLNSVLDQMEVFLRASGYSWLGQLTFSDEEIQYKFQYPENMNDESAFYSSAIDDFLIPIEDPPVQEKKFDDRCYLCGIEKSIMKENACFDVKCPKGSW